jgi:ComF family protein
MNHVGIRTLWQDLLHLFYPRLCPGCGDTLPAKNLVLCFSCTQSLPHTGFASLPDNPVERIFYGRCRIDSAHTEFYFSKGQAVQRLIHQLKYKGHEQAGLFLGRIMGDSLKNSGRFSDADYLIPMPLFASREKERGYNQSSILCKGMQEILNIPIAENNLIRIRATETQTRKDRSKRWQNVANSFSVKDPSKLRGAHLLLVDDVITTGATLEACCAALEAAGPARISIVVAAMAAK